MEGCYGQGPPDSWLKQDLHFSISSTQYRPVQLIEASFKSSKRRSLDVQGGPMQPLVQSYLGLGLRRVVCWELRDKKKQWSQEISWLKLVGIWDKIQEKIANILELPSLFWGHLLQLETTHWVRSVLALTKYGLYIVFFSGPWSVCSEVLIPLSIHLVIVIWK